MVMQTNISFSEKLWFSDGFQKDKSERKLSSVINLLLNAHYNIEEKSDQTTLTQVEDELLKLNAAKASLLKQQEYLKKLEEEEKNRYIIIRGDDVL